MLHTKTIWYKIHKKGEMLPLLNQFSISLEQLFAEDRREIISLERLV